MLILVHLQLHLFQVLGLCEDVLQTKQWWYKADLAYLQLHLFQVLGLCEDVRLQTRHWWCNDDLASSATSSPPGSGSVRRDPVDCKTLYGLPFLKTFSRFVFPCKWTHWSRSSYLLQTLCFITFRVVLEKKWKHRKVSQTPSIGIE